jgi:Sap-like sulfolipid-1-addressing protein
VQSLIPTVLGLGLAVAVCSPVSVVTVIVLLTMPAGRRRGIAFVLGWLLAIAVIAAVVVGFAHGQDFSSKKTTPSRAASWAEIVVGLVAIVAALRALRRQSPTGGSGGETRGWLSRLDRTKWPLAVVVGAFMLTYSLTIAAAAEILKAHVSTQGDVAAFAVFAVASIITIVAPVLVALLAPDRADEWLAAWRRWLLGNSRLIGLIALIVIGAALVARGAHDLIT